MELVRLHGVGEVVWGWGVGRGCKPSQPQNPPWGFPDVCFPLSLRISPAPWNDGTGDGPFPLLVTEVGVWERDWNPRAGAGITNRCSFSHSLTHPEGKHSQAGPSKTKWEAKVESYYERHRASPGLRRLSKRSRSDFLTSTFRRYTFISSSASRPLGWRHIRGCWRWGAAGVRCVRGDSWCCCGANVDGEE